MRMLILSMFFSMATQASPLPFESSSLPIEIEANETIICDERKNNCVVTGNAQASRGEFTLYADILTVHFEKGDTKKIKIITANGHVHLVHPERKAKSNTASYDLEHDTITLKGDALLHIPAKDQYIQADLITAYLTHDKKKELDHAIATGYVMLSTPNEVITAQAGTYFALTEKVTLRGHVTLLKGQNLIEGGHAKIDLKNNRAELYADSSKKKRIRGLIIPKDVKSYHKK